MSLALSWGFVDELKPFSLSQSVLVGHTQQLNERLGGQLCAPFLSTTILSSLLLTVITKLRYVVVTSSSDNHERLYNVKMLCYFRFTDHVFCL